MKICFSKKCILAADVPNKVDKSSSENTTFEHLEHSYPTSGPSAGSFDFLCSLTFDQKPTIPLRTSLKKSKKCWAKTILLKNRTPLSHLRLWRHDFRTPFRSVFFSKTNIDDSIPSLNIDQKPIIPLRTSPKVEKTSSKNTTFVNLEHPYRTSGLSAGSFASIVGATCCYLLLAATICYYLVLFAS